MERLEAVVSGKVQGVWYRDFVVREASALGLTGTTSNLPDGTVRVVAEGPREKLEALIGRLHEGPPLARVSGVVPVYLPATEEYDGFAIAYA
ncbi:MAG TPA: acylphosphatase [Candidatus Paceibacterota bacterium]|jgi:acylphosphatase